MYNSNLLYIVCTIDTTVDKSMKVRCRFNRVNLKTYKRFNRVICMMDIFAM